MHPQLRATPPHEAATRRFTDRDEPRQRFRQALQEDPPPHCRVLVWYGVGGQGKTALRSEFQTLIQAARQSKTQDIALAVVDFERPRPRHDPVDAMLHLRIGLAVDGLGGFPAFDVAFAELFRREYPGEDLRARHPQLFRKYRSEQMVGLLELAEDIADEIPGATLIYKLGTRLVGWAREWWATAEAKQLVGEIQALPAHRLRERLPAYLGADLRRALERPDAPRVVLMLDTYEALWRDTPRGALQNPRVDGWVRTLVEQAAGALVVVFCRDKLRWAELGSRWSTFLEQHLLDGLSDQDAAHFLQQAGVQSAAVSACIVAAARGLPFYLDLALDLHEHIVAIERRTPTPADFGETPGEVLERFRDHLAEAEVEDLEIASYAEVLDEALLTELSRSLRGRPADWTRLLQRSVMTLQSDGTLRMHALMRDTCQEREHRLRPRFHAEAHGFLFAHYDQVAASTVQLGLEHEDALRAAARHRLLAGRPGTPHWLLQRQQAFAHAGRWRALDDVFQRVDSALGPFAAGDTDAPGIWFYHHHASVLQHLWEFEGAARLYKLALANYPEDATSRAMPQYATILDALANVLWELGERQAAEPLYAEALQVYERAPDSYPIRHAYAVLRLSGCHAEAGLATPAKRLEDEALQRFEALATTHPREYAGFLLDLGRIRAAQDDLVGAEQLLRRSLERQLRTDGSRDAAATVRLELAVCAARQGDRATAAAMFDQTLAEHVDEYGATHPNTGRALHQQAAFWLNATPVHAHAAPQLARAGEILAPSLGETHPWTREARADLARAVGTAEA